MRVLLLHAMGHFPGGARSGRLPEFLSLEDLKKIPREKWATLLVRRDRTVFESLLSGEWTHRKRHELLEHNGVGRVGVLNGIGRVSWFFA